MDNVLADIAAGGTPKQLAKLLADGGIDVNARLRGEKQANGKKAPANTTALHIAVRKGRVPMVKALLAAGADVHLADNAGCNPLHYAAASDRIIVPLLDAGADINARSKKGETILHLIRVTKIVELLLRRGADPNLQDNEGRTALHRAVGLAPAKTTAALLEAGADPNIQDKNGWTALHHAVSSPCYNRAATKLLMQKGADPRLSSTVDVNEVKAGSTPVDAARACADKDTYHAKEYQACINAIERFAVP